MRSLQQVRQVIEFCPSEIDVASFHFTRIASGDLLEAEQRHAPVRCCDDAVADHRHEVLLQLPVDLHRCRV